MKRLILNKKNVPLLAGLFLFLIACTGGKELATKVEGHKLKLIIELSDSTYTRGQDEVKLLNCYLETLNPEDTFIIDIAYYKAFQFYGVAAGEERQMNLIFKEEFLKNQPILSIPPGKKQLLHSFPLSELLLTEKEKAHNWNWDWQHITEPLRSPVYRLDGTITEEVKFWFVIEAYNAVYVSSSATVKIQ